MDKIKELIKKYKEIILYLFFGVVTTVVSLAACWATLEIGVVFIHDSAGEPTELLDIIGSTVQWVVGVLVAFFTNKKWVFTDAEKGKNASTKQFFTFCGSRVVTYFIEVVINLAVIALLEDILGYKAFELELVVISFAITARFWAKVVSSVVVVVSNYFISKLLVFKKRKNN